MDTKTTEPTSSRADIVKRLLTPVALWAMNRVLDSPRIKSKSAVLEKNLDRRKKNALRSVRKAARNATRSPAWLAASAAAFAIGIGLIAKASRGR